MSILSLQLYTYSVASAHANELAGVIIFLAYTAATY